MLIYCALASSFEAPALPEETRAVIDTRANHRLDKRGDHVKCCAPSVSTILRNANVGTTNEVAAFPFENVLTIRKATDTLGNTFALNPFVKR